VTGSNNRAPVFASGFDNGAARKEGWQIVVRKNADRDHIKIEPIASAKRFVSPRDAREFVYIEAITAKTLLHRAALETLRLNRATSADWERLQKVFAGGRAKR
jgi:hypothetical protein